jgi:nucleoside-diphosphate-sugar epimerase
VLLVGLPNWAILIHTVWIVKGGGLRHEYLGLVAVGQFIHILAMADEKSATPSTVLPSVLIVGANGFLGRTIPPLLSARHPECKITLLDIAPSTSLEYDYFSGDITDLSSLIGIFQKVRPAVVIHSASPPIPTVGRGDEKLFTRVNVEGTRNVIKACNESGVRALIYTSSASVIYDGGDLVNANEKAPYATRHVDPYNASKVAPIHRPSD